MKYALFLDQIKVINKVFEINFTHSYTHDKDKNKHSMSVSII